MIPSTSARDVLDAIGDVINNLPLGMQSAVWLRIQAAASAYRDGATTMDEFVLKLLPANLFTQEERALLQAKGALPTIASA